MWKAIAADHIPSNHPSHAACTQPEGSSPPPTIITAVASCSRLVTSTIFRIATGHCFDATYLERFRAQANDYTICPCEHIPRRNTSYPPRRFMHTKEHVIFRCVITQPFRSRLLHGISSLCAAFRSIATATKLCEFLEDSKCSILCPIPVPRPDPP